MTNVENLDLEQERLLLERYRIEQDINLKSKQLELDRDRLGADLKRRHISTVGATVFAATIGVLGTALGVYWQGKSNALLERQKFEFSLLQRAFETRSRSDAATYLQFVNETGMINDPLLRERIAFFVRTPSSISSLPTASCENTMNGVPPTVSRKMSRTIFLLDRCYC
jgi:hypothetical protein